MSGNRAVDDEVADDHQPKLTFWQRLKYAMVKPDDSPGEKKEAEPTRSLEELQAAATSADDKERNIGLIAAPLAALVGLLVTANLINHARSLNQSTSVYETLTFVLLGVAVLMLAMAWFRKRLFLGILMAIFGLSIFNLRFWGFGIPFLMGGAWLLVRAYRLQKQVKLAGGGSGRAYGPPGSNRLPSAGGVLPRPSKRYTPPTEKLKRPSKSKPA
jgi:hypothetical protein